MFNIFDKRLKYLKKSKSNLAAKAIDLYNKNERSYKYYCKTTNSNENDCPLLCGPLVAKPPELYAFAYSVL